MGRPGSQDFEPKMLAAIVCRRNRVEPATVVFDNQGGFFFSLAQLHPDPVGRSMTAGVGQGFMRDPDQLAGVVRREVKGPF